MNKNIVIHICTDYGGGTRKHIDDLKILFPKYEHYIISKYPFLFNVRIEDVVLVHIHSVFPDIHIGWNVLDMITLFKSMKESIPIYLTLHDYQWLIKDKPYLSTWDNIIECIECYMLYNERNTVKLFDMVDRIFVPSQRVLTNYKKIMRNNLTILHMNKMHIVPHCDTYIRLEQLYIPTICQETINIAFVGLFIESKGSPLFIDLFNHFRKTECGLYKLKYHIFGDHRVHELSDNNELSEFVTFYGKYKDSDIIKELYSKNIHIVVFFSRLEETYSYVLTHLINSGLIMVYLNRGSLITRMNSEYPRMFPFSDFDYYKMKDSMNRAILYLIENQGRKDLINISHDIIISNEYRILYLP